MLSPRSLILINTMQTVDVLFNGKTCSHSVLSPRAHCPTSLWVPAAPSLHLHTPFPPPPCECAAAQAQKFLPHLFHAEALHQGNVLPKVVPGDEALCVHVELVPESHHFLVQLFHPAMGMSRFVSPSPPSTSALTPLIAQEVSAPLGHTPSSKLPVGHLDGLFVGRGDQEAHGGHHGLVSCGADHLPLRSLRVVLQHALVVPADGDLQWHQQQTRSPSAGLHPPAAHSPAVGKAASPSTPAADQAKARDAAKWSSTFMSGEEGARKQSWLPHTCWFG